MLGPEQLIRTTLGLPWAIARRIVGIGVGLLPGSRDGDEDWERPRTATTEHDDHDDHEVDASQAADEALARDREPVEEAIFTPDDDFFDEEEHVDAEVEVVAESADPEATDGPGPQFHVDEPWDGYRRMKVAEIIGQLEGQSPEVLAAVELYETTHRKRRGVLDAVAAASRA